MVDFNKELNFNSLKNLFKGGDSLGVSSKALTLIVVNFLLSFIAIYYIFLLLENNTNYENEKANYAQINSEITSLNKKLETNIKNNLTYFQNLFTAPKSDDELGDKITRLINSYDLKLNSIDLDKKVGKSKGISLEVSGSYFKLIKFNGALNKTVASSQLMKLEVKKITKSNDLKLKLEFIFEKPPRVEDLPNLKNYQVQINHDDTFVQPIKLMTAIVNLFISSAQAQEKTLTVFEEFYLDARKQGLETFEFTDKEGVTRTYNTGLNNDSFNSTDSVKLIETGFVENDNGNTDSQRDPFSEPKINKIPKATNDAQPSYNENDFYLSGTLISKKNNFCLVINPYGESLILKVNDKLSSGATIREVSHNSIKVSYLNSPTLKEIKIGEQIK
ncbi:MAG: hypothetical protein ISQ46_05675 [Methylophilaceae bacterium]|nr:hypothetical protein [Methylophilaceae bacterium]